MGVMCVRNSDDEYIPPSGSKATVLIENMSTQGDPALKKAITFDNYKKFKWINHI